MINSYIINYFPLNVLKFTDPISILSIKGKRFKGLEDFNDWEAFGGERLKGEGVFERDEEGLAALE